MLYRNLAKLSLLLMLCMIVCASVRAQVTTLKTPAPPPPDTLMVEASRRQSPQIVTVVHRLNGIKALALLGRYGQAVTMVDDDVVTASDAVTGITAGFVLADGQSVVARLPQAEAEVEVSATGYSYSFQTAAPNAAPRAPVASRAATASTSPRALFPPDAAGFVVVQANGKQLAARYIGLDGVSGLSLLKITGLKIPAARDASEEELAVGQTVRLFAPVRVVKASGGAQAMVALRVGEIEGKITEITHTSTGKIARLIVRAPNLSAQIVGGVALNESGEAVGIVETSNAQVARLIPVASVRRAAERVQTRQASVPRPWLGIRGMPVAATPLEKFFLNGWGATEAAALKGKNEGILLTSVAPGTPAAFANLKAGDVIVRVNDYEIKSAEDFSYVLNEAGSGATVNFTVFRGQTPTATTLFTPATPPVVVQVPQPLFTPEAFNIKPFDISVKLGEALNPTRAMKLAEGYSALRNLNLLPTLARGIETAALSQKAAAHLGARSGILVLYVESESAGARAGLRVFDVIETVEGKPAGRTTFASLLSQGNPQRVTLGIVRDHRKLEITIQQQETPGP